jgi:hypothetical protein
VWQIQLFFSDQGALWPTVMAIDEAFTMNFPHNDPAQLEEMSKGFLTTQVSF